MTHIRNSLFVPDATQFFGGVIMTFSLANKDALEVYRKNMFEIQKYFNDDLQILVVTTLRPG